MTEIAYHHCPGCGKPQKPFLRYPWHFCNDCRELAVDHAGRKLHFGNESMGGGFVWQIEGQDETYSSYGLLCLIHNRPVHVGEARFGGIVAQPWTQEPNSDDKVADLRRRDPNFEAFRRIRPGPGR
ncbi:hypothetical protein [Flavimaricola marinus]|uniref:ADP-ribosylglycohydrolase n=1 Tax=Flavimaricola marinus TaxID=1819565 RepID=A0A238LHR0_9RHOB|nr:hypothetical protein [Flavimaricola marinus]SMY08410.1 hypothetical protein LOM8899_02561 [Flavimaricola marinus]